MLPLFLSRLVTRVSIRLSTEATWGSRPPMALLSSVAMVLIWLMPPPLSSSDSAPKTSSTSGLRLVRAIGMAAPSARGPAAAWVAAAARVLAGGGESWMYFSPRRLDCSRWA